MSRFDCISCNASIQVYEGMWQKTLRCLKKDHDESHEDNIFFSIPLSMEVGHNEVFNVVRTLIHLPILTR